MSLTDTLKIAASIVIATAQQQNGA